MQQSFSFGASAILAMSGTVCAVTGILSEEMKPTAIGLVLIFAAGVFATLYVGARWTARQPD